jgi:hypothetical protein
VTRNDNDDDDDDNNNDNNNNIIIIHRTYTSTWIVHAYDSGVH